MVTMDDEVKLLALVGLFAFFGFLAYLAWQKQGSATLSASLLRQYGVKV